MVLPAPKATLNPNEPYPCSDEQADALVENWGGQGVIKMKPGESVEDAAYRGRKQRYTFFVWNIQNFRRLNASQAGRQLEIFLPQDHHRSMLREVKALQGEFAQDEVMTAPIPTVPDVNPIAQELENYGVPAAAGAVKVGGLDIDAL